MKNLLLALLMATTVGYAQQPRDTVPRQLVQQINWMEQQGFPARSYQWGQPAVDLHLRQALTHRKRSKGYTTGGVTLIAVGSILGMVGMIGMATTSVVSAISFGTNNDPDPDATGHIIMTGMGAAMLGGGITLTVMGAKHRHWARQQLKLAQKRYHEL